MSSAAPDGETGTFRLIYRSHDRVRQDHRKAELGAIFSAARSNNKKLGVTGALLTDGDWFVQILEGEESTVQNLFNKIERDPRHERVEVLEEGPVDGRTFSRWSMAMVADHGEPDIPIIAGKRGIAPAAPHDLTEDQQEVLDTMRAAAEGKAGAD